MVEETKLAGGRTKRVLQDPRDSEKVIVELTDRITARDGAVSSTILGKGIDGTTTVCNVFRVLDRCGVPTAFLTQESERSFKAWKCGMIPYEFVVRRAADGSYLLRHPGAERGSRFLRPRLEVYLKTHQRNWFGTPLPIDDPLVVFEDPFRAGGRALLYRPDQPLGGQQPFLELAEYPLAGAPQDFAAVCARAVRAFLILEKCWDMLGYRLNDLKTEYGVTPAGAIVLADVIDNDSWNVVQGTEHLDKQVFRDGATASFVAERYRTVSRLTGLFRLPRQCVEVWLDSPALDITPFLGAFARYSGPENRGDVMMSLIRSSMDVDGEDGIDDRLLAFMNDDLEHVIVSGGDPDAPTAGYLALHSPFPVVQAREEVRSCSRRGLSDDAVRLALNILAERNPRLWADLQLARLGFDNLSLP